MAINRIVYAYIAEEENYPDGAVLIREGMKNDCVYVILEGNIKIKKKIPRGQVTLATLKEGAFFGEMVFLATGENVRSVSIVAADGPVRLGLLDTHRLVRDYAAVPSPIKSLIGLLIKRLRAANEEVCRIVVAAQRRTATVKA